MFKSIIVPLDGSILASRALPFATRLAQAEGAKVILVRAVQAVTIAVADPTTPAGGAVPGAVEEIERTDVEIAREELASAVEQLAAAGVAATGTVYEYTENPADEIIAAANEHGGDLIVISTHGRTGLGRALYGSVAERIMHRTRLPILLVTPASSHAWPAKQAGSAGQILVTLDGSPFAEEALEPAAELARVLEAGITLLQVVEPILGFSAPDGVLMYAEPIEDKLAHARQYLSGLTSRLQARGLDVRTAVGTGHPAAVISTAAGDANVLAVVAATHGRSGIAAVVLGSVATGILHGATEPVLLVRPADARNS